MAPSAEREEDMSNIDSLIGEKVTVFQSVTRLAPEGREAVSGTLLAHSNGVVVLKDWSACYHKVPHGGLAPKAVAEVGGLLIIDLQGKREVKPFKPNPRGEFFAVYKVFCDEYGLDAKDRSLRLAIARFLVRGQYTTMSGWSDVTWGNATYRLKRFGFTDPAR